MKRVKCLQGLGVTRLISLLDHHVNFLFEYNEKDNVIEPDERNYHNSI